MEITKKQAKVDLEKIMKQFGILSDGTEKDKAAELVMQNIGCIKSMLGDIEFIEEQYINNPRAFEILPSKAHEILKNYLKGSINKDKARKELDDASIQYREAFQEMGVSYVGIY